MRGNTITRLSLLVGIWVGTSAVWAQDDGWSPIQRPSTPPAPLRQTPSPASVTPAVKLGKPIVSLGKPTPLSSVEQVEVSRKIPQPPAPRIPDATAPVAIASSTRTVRAQAPDSAPPPVTGGVVPPPGGTLPVYGNEAFNNGVVVPNASFTDRTWGFVQQSFARRSGQLFQSDHGGDLDQLSSPVSSPFLAEDPRALTEVRPIFLYQTISGSNPVFRGGDLQFYGLQARIAFNERWSLVINKLGGISFNPDDKTFANDDSGFAEVWLGPKFTFYRDECNNTVAAAGLTFQIPTSNKAFQDTGDLSISPYLSFASSFGRLPQGYGNFNFMSTTGFAVATDDQRSDFFYTTLHLDFDVGGQHKLYPMVELNWIRYINNGGARPLTFEGGDLINFGSTAVSGENIVTLATGARYKFSESIQVGAAFEFPLQSEDDLNEFRFTFDVILRY